MCDSMLLHAIRTIRLLELRHLAGVLVRGVSDGLLLEIWMLSLLSSLILSLLVVVVVVV